MKRLLLICSLICSITSCSEKKSSSNSTAVYTLIDVTASTENQKEKLQLDYGQLIRLFELDKDPDMHALYYQSLITEVHLNRVFKHELKPSDFSNYNKFRRKLAVRTFAKYVQASLAEIQNADFGRPASSVFIPVAQSINKLAASGAQKQVMLIQSDLFENTDIFTTYDSGKLKKVDKSLLEILEKEAPITGSLDQMTVYIIYQPDAASDSSFRAISNVYKQYLESKGAKVRIVANLAI